MTLSSLRLLGVGDWLAGDREDGYLRHRLNYPACHAKPDSISAATVDELVTVTKEELVPFLRWRGVRS